MNKIISILLAALLLGIVQVQARVGGGENELREELQRRLTELQLKIDALEKALPSVENTVRESTNEIDDLQRRKLSGSCAITSSGDTCVLPNNLQVSSTVSVVGPAVRAGSLSVVGELNVQGNLGVNGTFSHTGTLTSVAGNLNVNMEATINDDMAVIGNMDVTNNMIFWGNLDITGPDSTTTFLNDLHVKTDAVFSGASTMLGDVIVDGPFNGVPPNTKPSSTYYELAIKSQYIDIKKKSYWEGKVSLKVDNNYQDMKVDDLIIGAGGCSGTNCFVNF